MPVKSTVIKIGASDIWVDEQNILRVKVYEGAELNLKEVKIYFEAYCELGCNKNNKLLQLMDVQVNAHMTKEAREYVAQNAEKFFIASAVITANLAVRLIANFITKFYKLEVPFKLFETEEKALEWLLKYRKLD